MPRAELRIAYPVDDLELEAHCLDALAEALTAINIGWMLEHPEAPCCLACGGVRYEPPRLCGTPVVCQLVEAAPIILARRRATCLGIACYTAAKRRIAGTPCRVACAPLVDDRGNAIPQSWHALVVDADGTVHDPTAELEHEQRAAARQAPAPDKPSCSTCGA